jgi:hypothetical protein
MMVTLTMGQGFWTPMKLIAGTTHGVDVLIGGAGIVLWGLIIHMMVSAGYGVLFALVMPRSTRPGAALVAGLIYGALIWAFMGSLIVPAINPTMHARLAMMSGWFFLEHLLYGVGASLAPALRRRFGGRSPDRQNSGTSSPPRASEGPTSRGAMGRTALLAGPARDPG